MELSAFFLALAVWFLVSAISKAGRSSGSHPRVPHRPARPPSQLGLRRPATDQEGGRVELMLRELRLALEGAAESQRPARKPALRQPEITEGSSLEIEPEATSLEDEVRRSDRRSVDQDDEAEAIVARRIKAAAARDQATPGGRPAGPAAEIAQEPADHTATHGYTRQHLRDAMVWREILGPPVSER